MAAAPTASMGKQEQKRVLLQAAFDGNACLLKKMARVLDTAGRGEAAVLAVTDDGSGSTALHLAAMEGRMDVLRYLVEELRLHVDPCNARGEIPLFCSTLYGRTDITRYLLDHGADPTIVGQTGSPVHIAAVKGDCETLQLLLLRGTNVDIDSVPGAPLHLAAAYGKDRTVRILLEHHANPNKVANADNTPLGMAIWAKSLECVKLLIKAGADVNFIFSSGETYVAMAAVCGLTDIMKCLLEAGANPNIPDGFGRTPVEIAAFQGRRQDVEVLFPFTSHIPTIWDWRIDGIISHVKSFCLNQMDKRKCELKRNDLKFQAEAFKNKDYLSALTLYTSALRFSSSYNDDDVANLLANRSLCWLHLEDGENALKDANASRVLRPRWPKACYRQGSALMSLKDYGRACQFFAEGLKLDPTNVEIQTALRGALEMSE